MNDDTKEHDVGYNLSITGPDGVLLGSVRLDGMNLANPIESRYLGELVQAEMGGDAVAACAALDDEGQG